MCNTTKEKSISNDDMQYEVTIDYLTTVRTKDMSLALCLIETLQAAQDWNRIQLTITKKEEETKDAAYVATSNETQS